jgi:iron complex transport system ATP-binding protein
MTRLRAKDLYLSVDRRTLLGDFNVDMRTGETWAILGANGSGKTTLLHTLAGLREPQAGTVFVDDTPLAAFTHRQRARQIGILFQDYDTPFPGSVMDTVLSARYPYAGWHQLLQDSDSDREIAAACLKLLGLQAMSHRSLATLSGGERRRVQIAALLAQSTPIRLLDEPTNHLDLRHQVETLKIVCGTHPGIVPLRSPADINVLVLHDINQATSYCSHAIMLFADGTSSCGTLDDIIHKKSLEKLYQCELREVKTGPRKIYLPA